MTDVHADPQTPQPGLEPGPPKKLRVAAVGDLHVGEAAVKTFVQEAVDDANHIENSIRMLRTERSVVLLHYSPVVDTVMGEPPEIHAFLGSSRLGETIDRYDNISLVVHGHAHRGQPEGRTNKGTPVYNVALPVLRALGDTPYRVFQV